MSRYKGQVQELLKEQNDYDDRRGKLHEQVSMLLTGFIDSLGQFVKEAQAAGLRGVKPCQPETQPQGLVEVSFALANLDWLLIAPYKAARVTLSRDILASKMFIYCRGNEQSEPILTISVMETDKGNYQARIDMSATLGKTPLKHWHRIDQTTGHGAAACVIDHLYSYKSIWPDRQPALAQIRARTSEERPLGFLHLDRE
jgi:hypothetical protein